jgi:hypothetical protein
MRIEKIPKKVFGSNGEFTILRLLYNNGYDKFKREELDVPLEVFNLPAEQKYKLMLEDFEFEMMEEEFDRKSVDLFDADCVLELYFPFEPNSKSVLRKYGDFYISFLKLDENHLTTKVLFENMHFPNYYYHKEYFEYQNRLYKITHRLDYDLIDDYPQTATQDLTNIVAKNKLVVYLKCLKRRYGKPMFAEIFKPDDIIKFLDYMYPNRGVNLFGLMKARYVDKNLPLEGWGIDDFIWFMYLSEEFLHTT